MGRIFMGDFAPKKEIDVPVVSCQGWTNPCEFCDKRFGHWVDASEENLAKVPMRPGVIMVGLKSKNCTEIVSITINSSNIQKLGPSCIDYVKHGIADKKSKVTKAAIICRWMAFNDIEDKDVVYLFAHWCNNGVLPRFQKSWPGLNILQKTESLIFSEDLKKWCYPKQDAFWRKPKPLFTKLAEEVKGCNWSQPCEVCDIYFSPWKRLDDVVANDLAPDHDGIYMVSVSCGKTREVVDIGYNGNVLVNIKKGLEYYFHSVSDLRRKELANRNAFYDVRWMVVADPESDDACFLYAHWLNADTSMSYISYFLDYYFGKVQRKKNFIVRTRDRKWCYEVDAFKQFKETKAKCKKRILYDLQEDIYFLIYGR